VAAPRNPFQYAIVRVVPDIARGEFLNAGVILFCPTQRYLNARIHLDRARLTALAPEIDLETVATYLETIPKVCAGGGEAGSIGALPQSQRFHWLVAPRSTIIQTSPVHAGVSHDLDAALDALFEKLVLLPPG
jgi:hypothetical protein